MKNRKYIFPRIVLLMQSFGELTSITRKRMHMYARLHVAHGELESLTTKLIQEVLSSCAWGILRAFPSSRVRLEQALREKVAVKKRQRMTRDGVQDVRRNIIILLSQVSVVSKETLLTIGKGSRRREKAMVSYAWQSSSSCTGSS